ncbi:MAG TPA: 6-phosphogluconolactonase [Chitinophagales bacterium]|nr:6-phosphogluconolactonase [Chitinophagales bacterium]
MKQDIQLHYQAPDTRYYKTKEEFDEAVGRDFIKHANQASKEKRKFLVCLSHGQSPAGPYGYILQHFHKIKTPQYIYFAFLNSPLKSQEGLQGIMDAGSFLKRLLRDGFIKKEQVFGRNIEQESLEEYAVAYNDALAEFLEKNKKTGFDYVFLASNPRGRIGGIERNSKSFDSKEISVIVTVNKEKELTTTPHFLLKSRRIAFLATKSDKRRPLAWLYSTTGKPNESPSFIRFIDNVKERMTVFIDDKALTWPEIEIKRETPYGVSTIRVDLANPYRENAKEKLPVVLLIHGFLGLNSFDGLLTSLPSTKYIAAAMHYGSIPSDLPIDDYSHHVALNIQAAVEYFGAKGHPVYIFDHSMGNTYFMMIDQQLQDYPGIQKYLCGRIGANSFFGEEAKHALLGFLDNVIIPSMTFSGNLVEKSVLVALRRVIPLDSKSGVRKRAIDLTERLIAKDAGERSMVWKAVKERIVYLMTNMDSLPHLNRIPIEKALNKVPPKIFAIQSHSALQQSMAFDKQEGLVNTPKWNIPVLFLKSDRDGVAKFVPRLCQGSNVEVIDITDKNEKDLFREHLYHMVHPLHTAQLIDEFITKAENKRKNQA